MGLRLMDPSGRLVPCPESRVGADGVFPLLIEQGYALSQEGRVQVLELPRGVAGGTLGASTPRWRLEGTFGARSRRIGGRLYSPVELVQELRAFVQFYFDERFRRTERQAPLVELVFDDLDRGLHWVVVPAGLPEIRMSAREPARPYWSMELRGIRPATSRPPQRDDLGERLAPQDPGGVGAALPGLLGGVVPTRLTPPAPSPTLTPPLPQYPTPPPSPHGSGLLPQDTPPALAAHGLAQAAANVAGALLTGELSPDEAREELAQIAEEAQALEEAQSAYAAQKGVEASAQAVTVAQALAPGDPVANVLGQVRAFLEAWEAGRDAVEQVAALAAALADAWQGLDPASLLGAAENILEAAFPQAGAREAFRALRRLLGRLEGKPPGALGAELALALLGAYAPPEARHSLTRLRLGVDWALRALGR